MENISDNKAATAINTVVEEAVEKTDTIAVATIEDNNVATINENEATNVETDATTLCDGEGVSSDVNGNGKSKDQWHLDSCGFQKAWKKLKNDKKNPGGDSGVIVAVIDTGVDFDHIDLAANMWKNTAVIPY
jgi:hypothetical protein